MIGWRAKRKGLPRTPRGRRAYAIGDIHGRLDLLDRLLLTIENDVERRPSRKTALVFLGDIIDRGPDSRGVIERLRNYRHELLQPYFLTGNHEEVLLRMLNGERGILASWLKYGGAQCLESYGFDPAKLDVRNERASLSAIKDIIPDAHARFIGSFSDTLLFGDYLFVHAGIRPGIDLTLQSQTDLRWIRSPFLEDRSDHGIIVVHGHTISNEVEIEENRIGIDTGAYRTGTLSALAVDGEERWLLDTAAAEESSLLTFG
jgi:serine/threonine protein phosphatase 1